MLGGEGGIDLVPGSLVLDTPTGDGQMHLGERGREQRCRQQKGENERQDFLHVDTSFIFYGMRQ